MSDRAKEKLISVLRVIVGTGSVLLEEAALYTHDPIPEEAVDEFRKDWEAAGEKLDNALKTARRKHGHRESETKGC